jgi:hypothetical protein
VQAQRPKQIGKLNAKKQILALQAGILLPWKEVPELQAIV